MLSKPSSSGVFASIASIREMLSPAGDAFLVEEMDETGPAFQVDDVAPAKSELSLVSLSRTECAVGGWEELIWAAAAPV